MAPRLPADVALQLNSVGWPVWLLCTSVSVSVFSVIALFAYTRMHAAEEERKRKLQARQQSLGQYEVMWSFPEKEDKYARFKRWAEVLRFKPREARPPISTEGARLDVKVALEVFYREAEAAGISTTTATSSPAIPTSPKHNAVSIPEDHAAAVLREKVKERILQFLIECGPPKGLIPITEEDRSISNTPSVPSTPRYSTAQSSPNPFSQASQAQHAVDMRKLMEAAAESSTPCTPRTSRPQSSPRPPPALSLDAEPVLRTETGETVTRELLWAVLARIHAEAQNAAAAAAVAAPAPPVPTSPDVSPVPSTEGSIPEASSSRGSNLTEPLLGEWRNPLQS